MEQYPCDNCGEPVPMSLKVRKHPGSIEENYIQCPHCDEEFISYVTDLYARNLQKETKKHHEKYMKNRGKLSLHMAKLKNELEENRKASE